MSEGIDESHVEDAALGWFGELGYAVGHGPHLAPGEAAAERASFGEVVLVVGKSMSISLRSQNSVMLGVLTSLVKM